MEYTSSRLQTVADWVAARPDLYVTGGNAFDWRWRQHKRRYVESGAVLMVGGRRMVNPQLCEAIEMEIAREGTRAMLDREAAQVSEGDA